MVFHIRDAVEAGNEALNMPFLRSVFDNPFLSAAIATVICIGLVFLLVSDMDKMELAKLGLFMYFTMVIILFLNNRMLLQRIDTAVSGRGDGLDDDFTRPLNDRWKPSGVLHAEHVNEESDDENDHVSAHRGVEGAREPPRPTAVQTAFNDVAASSLYPINWLST